MSQHSIRRTGFRRDGAALIHQSITRHLFILLLMIPAWVGGASQQEPGDPPGAFRHSGATDGSAGAPLEPGFFIAASDGDSTLRVYRTGQPGPPLASANLAAALRMPPQWPKAQIEAAASLGDQIYWITSHSRSRNGELRPASHRFFATHVSRSGDSWKIALSGQPYSSLAEDIYNDPRLRQMGLAEAAQPYINIDPYLSPEARGLNIEGLAATPDGHLLIGLRNPLIQVMAIILPLENPAEIVQAGAHARLGEPILLDLGGRAIRDMAWDAENKRFLIIAGPNRSGGDFRLYAWSGKPNEAPQPLAPVDFGSMHPEALIILGDKSGIEVLSDDLHSKGKREGLNQDQSGEANFRGLMLDPTILKPGAPTR